MCVCVWSHDMKEVCLSREGICVCVCVSHDMKEVYLSREGICVCVVS